MTDLQIQQSSLPAESLLGPREHGARRAHGILGGGARGVAAHPAAVEALLRVQLQVAADALKLGDAKLLRRSFSDFFTLAFENQDEGEFEIGRVSSSGEPIPQILVMITE